jgi:hypothetical protein
METWKWNYGTAWVQRRLYGAGAGGGDDGDLPMRDKSR